MELNLSCLAIFGSFLLNCLTDYINTVRAILRIERKKCSTFLVFRNVNFSEFAFLFNFYTIAPWLERSEFKTNDF